MQHDAMRFGRELYRFRLATVGLVAFLVPLTVTLSGAEMVALAMMVPAALTWWSAAHRWMAAGGWRPRTLGLASLLEALVIAALVYGYGGPVSPFLLLYVPLAIQAAGALPPAGALLAAGYAVASLWAVLRFTPGPWPAWGLVPVGAALLAAGALAWWAADRRRRAHTERTRLRRLANQRRLEALAVPSRHVEGAESPFWRALVGTLREEHRFAEAAVVRFGPGEVQIAASHRPAAWRWLAERHVDLLRARVATGTPEVFAEDGGVAGRAIVFWPVPTPPGGVPTLIGVLVPRLRPDLDALGRQLGRWLPIAQLALAAEQPHLVLDRTPVAWKGLVEAVVRRLDRKLAGHLVMMDVAPGKVAADGALLADAVAHLVEAALDGAPKGTQVRITVRPAERGWRFGVETSADPARAKDPAALRLAQQIVHAHGGRMEVGAGASGDRRWGFRLPPA